jgi:hypothetical protein
MAWVAGTGAQDTWYFGRMTAAYKFKDRLTHNPAAIGEYLDRVPFTSPISDAQATEYFDILSVYGMGLASATRLLSIKRPDYFLPLNGGNKELLSEILGGRPIDSAHSHLSFHHTL